MRNSFIISLIVALPLFTSGETQCPEFFKNNPDVPCYFLKDRCYCFSKSFFYSPWNDAKYYCRSANYTLITLDSASKEALILQHLINTPEIQQPWYWIAGTYGASWEWQTGPLPGLPFNYTNWDQDRPIYSRPGCCTELNFSLYNGKWADVPCSFTNYFICEGYPTPQAYIR